jgi:hypothetical protein
MKVYCSTCGSGTNYTMTKPKFCSSCGGAFSALAKDINTSRSFGIVSLKDLAVGEAQQNDGYVRESDPTYSKESFSEDFRRDAGSSRNHESTQET